MQFFLNACHRLEVWLAAALIGLSLVHAGMVARAMATSSLSTDEFGTVGTFSSRGPGRVLTDYRAPKNHIFFNLLNSVLPGRESWNPARVRALSILATLLTAVVIVVWTAWRGRLAEGAVLLGLWSLAPSMLTLSMEARGYGFLALFAVVAAVAVTEYLRTLRRGWLVTLAGASVLGVYTVPSFLFLAAPLLGLLWLTQRTRETFITGAATAALILLLYAPVLRQLVTAYTEFTPDREGMEFAPADSLVRVVRMYLLSCHNWQAALLLGALLLTPFAVARWRPAGERLGPCLVAASCALYFGTLVYLRTPPLRVAACAILPAALTGLLAMGDAVRALRLPAVRAVLFGGLAAWLIFATGRAIRDFDFIPTENWTLAARAIDTAFPRSLKIEFGRYAKYLKQTLPGSSARRADFDAAQFTAGELAVADASNKWAEGRQFHAPPGLPGIVEWTIPGTIRDVVLTFRRPPESGLPRNLYPPGAPIPRGGMTWRITPPPGARSLVVLLDRPVTSRSLRVEAKGAVLAGNAVVVPIEGASPFGLFLLPRVGNLAIIDAWIFPQ